MRPSGPFIRRDDQAGERITHDQKIIITGDDGIGLSDMRQYQKHLVFRIAFPA